jgi:predicted alpha/beta superfamily hydrolase
MLLSCRKTVTAAIIACCAMMATSFAASPHRESIVFSYTGDVGFGNSVFVTGNHPDLGAWDVTKARKLRFTPGNVWTGQIAVQAGTALQHRFLSRATATDRWCDAANGTFLSGVLTQQVAAQPAAPYRGKTIYYLSGWNAANLFLRSGSEWVTVPMARLGPGRVAGESLFKVAGVGEAGESLEFVFNDGAGRWDNPSGGGNYLTAADVFQLQDGSVFAYQPSASVSAPQVVSRFVGSTALGIAGRNVRVYLPRGYAENTWKRYPVLYFHDGQNVFDPGGSFGSWSADATATREIAQGRMRETILVAIDNDGANRIAEYLPPTDSYAGTPGRADAYAAFVIHNVRPYVDTTFRTLNDPANTLTAGSSLGGLVSLYLARETAVFGKCGVMSPAFWIAPNWVSSIAAQGKKPIRVYFDMGTAEGASYFSDALRVHDGHLAQGHAINDDLTFVAGCGHGHNEAAWAARLPELYRRLLPAAEEPQPLAQRDFPPAFSVSEVRRGEGRARLSYTSLFGFSYDLERSTDLATWNRVLTTPAEPLPWAVRSVEDAALPTGARVFWRLRWNSAGAAR